MNNGLVSMRNVSMVAVLVSSLCASVGLSAEAISGKVTKVRDADTIVERGIPVRLQGVDAPENGTRAGNEATAAMKRFVRGKTVTCELTGERTHDRWVGICYTDEGHDIGATMIANGYAGLSSVLWWSVSLARTGRRAFAAAASQILLIFIYTSL